MAAYADFEPQRLKHLELIQAVIGRLGGNGFLVKGWALTVAGAFFGFAVNSNKVRLAIAAIVPTVVFWLLDAYFLRAERLFRKLYGWTQGPGRSVLVGSTGGASGQLSALDSLQKAAGEGCDARGRTSIGEEGTIAPAMDLYWIPLGGGSVDSGCFATRSVSGGEAPSRMIWPM